MNFSNKRGFFESWNVCTRVRRKSERRPDSLDLGQADAGSIRHVSTPRARAACFCGVLRSPAISSRRPQSADVTSRMIPALISRA